jgi:hypothetical protein
VPSSSSSAWKTAHPFSAAEERVETNSLGHCAGQDQTSNIVKERGYNNNFASVLVHRERAGYHSRTLRMELHGLANGLRNTRVRDKSPESLRSQGQVLDCVHAQVSNGALQGINFLRQLRRKRC